MSTLAHGSSSFCMSTPARSLARLPWPVALTVSDLVVIGLKDEQMLDESGGKIAMGRVTLARKNTMARRKRTPCSSQASDRA